MDQKQEDEVNLFELSRTVWEGKWTIIGVTFIAVLLGFAYIFSIQNSFQGSTRISEGKQSAFFDYIAINDILEYKNLLSPKASYGYLVDAPTVFQMTIDEFNDYDEMISVLKKSKFVNR